MPKVECISEAIRAFFDWLTLWNKTDERRKDKRSIRIGQDLVELVQRINISDVHIRAEWGEVQKDIIKAKAKAHEFERSLD